tara:strand:+ start:664 stop:1095 length:432 start_codon:yes stop_codon:yes gene_type:complete
MEPKNLDIKGRNLSKEEQKKLFQYFDEMDYLTDTMNIVQRNIVAAQDEEAASIWVQWILNAALQDFDSIVNALEEAKTYCCEKCNEKYPKHLLQWNEYCDKWVRVYEDYTEPITQTFLQRLFKRPVKYKTLQRYVDTVLKEEE